MKAQEFLEDQQITVKEVVDARKVRFDKAAAAEFLKDYKEITIAKGKKSTTWNPAQDPMDDILKQAMGPSGNLRAPTYVSGKKVLIGFNAELYMNWF
jgi:hypothetical protein